MSMYLNDQAIINSTEDELGREKFAESVANSLILKPTQACLTVSLEGEWGAGKTSVINMIKGYLQQIGMPVTIVEYNPWLVGNPDSLIQDFLMQLSAKVGSSSASDAATKVAEELMAYASLFSVVKLIPGAEPWASIVGKVFSSFGKSTKKIAELKKLDLLGRKAAVAKAMKQLNVPIVIIIDDIDRLTPKETFQVLRLVKAVADFSGTAFLLAFDPKYLSIVLTENGIENTPEYINKIVQLRIPLPVASPKGMEKMTQSEFDGLGVDKLTSEFEQDLDRSSYIYNQFIKRLLRTPRDIKRMANLLRLSLSLVEGQVCFADLLSLATIATVAPNIYEHIKSTPEAYVGRNIDTEIFSWEMDSKDYIESLKTERENQLERYDHVKRMALVDLLEFIFPEIGERTWEIFGGVSADSAGRISQVKRLHTALHFGTPKGYLSDKEIRDFMAGEVNRTEFLEGVTHQEKTVRFFEMVGARVRQFSAEANSYMESIYQWVLASLDHVSESQRREFGYASPYERSVWLTLEVLQHLQSPNEYLMCLCKKSEYLLVSCSVIRSLINESVESRSLAQFKDLDAQSLKSLLGEKIIEALDSRPRYLYGYESRLVWALRDIALEKLQDFFGNLIAQNQILRIVELIGVNGSGPDGDYVHIRKDWFPENMNYELVKLQAIEELSKNHSEVVQAGLRSMLHQRAEYPKTS